MKKEDIHLGDWQRILFGDSPLIFLVEVIIRSIITYVVLLLVLKLMGKRMSGRLTTTEMAVMLMFGAVVSSAMQIPNRGVIEGSFVLFVMLLLQRGYTLWTVHNRKVEKQTLGTTSLLVRDGMIEPKHMEKELLTLHQLAANLRSKSIIQLGQLKRLYMEPNGEFSVIEMKEEVPGLALLPHDPGLRLEQYDLVDDRLVCCECGNPYEKDKWPGKCDNCGGETSVKAVIKKKQAGQPQ